MGNGGIRDIAWKFLNSDGQGTLVKLLIRISVLGMAVGVAALVIVFSVIQGFKDEFAKAVSNAQGHVSFTTREKAFLDDPEMRSEILRFSGKGAILQSYLSTEAMAVTPASQSGVLYQGVEPSFYKQTGAVVVGGHWPVKPDDVAIGESLAQRLGLKIGDRFEIVLADPSQVLPRRYLKNISGIFKYGFYDVDSKLVLSGLGQLQDELELGPRVSGYKIYLGDLGLTAQVGESLRDRFPFPYKIREWYSLHRNLLMAVQHQKRVIGVLLSSIVLLAVFNVISALLIFSKEREFDFAILKVMGASRKDLIFLLSILGAWIGVVGVSVGLVLSSGVLLLIQFAPFLRIPPEIYYLDRIPMRWNGMEIVQIGFLALFLTVLVSFVAGGWIARRSPMEGVRGAQ